MFSKELFWQLYDEYLTSVITSCVTFGKIFNLSELQLSNLLNEIISHSGGKKEYM